MANDRRHLQHLVDLAKEPSEERRRQLLKEVTDLFMNSSDGLSETERGHFGDIMGRVAAEMESKVRQVLSERLARHAGAPHDLIAQLANDSIEVARPVLEHSPVLDETDLVAIASHQSQDHLAAVAVRPSVSETVSDHLVARGDDRVLLSLVSNRGARFSRAGMAAVVDRAEANAQLHKPLINRGDVPPDMLHRMFWTVSAPLRQKILEATANIPGDEVDRLLADAETEIMAGLSTLATGHTVKGPAFDPSTIDMAEKFAHNKEAAGQLTPDLLVQLLRQGQVAYFVTGFARLVGVDTQTARRILYDPSGEAVAIACKAVAFDRVYFSNLLLMTDQSGSRRPEEIQKLAEIYDQIAPETAQRAMRFWKLRAKTLGKIG
ncbi:MAG: DUF2336 domain-containing protein [Magnetospirillum sp. WYHS-4]